MKKIVLVLIIVALDAAVALAATRPTDEEIMKLVETNAQATAAGDVEAILATGHSESMAMVGIEEVVAQLSAWKLDYEVVDVRFVAMSGEYALIRLTQHTRRVSGPAFIDNEIEAIWALRQENGAWKFWSQMVLRLEALE